MDKKKLYLIGAAILGVVAIVGGIIWYRSRNGVTASRKAERNINIKRTDA